MIKVLFIAECVTLAHAARPLSLAQGLPQAEFAAEIAWSPRYASLFPGLELRTHTLDSLSSQAFAERLAKGSPVYTQAELLAYIRADERLLTHTRPDIVVGDFRLSLSISARLAGIPYLAISNAYWSPYANLHIPVPDLPMLSVLGEGMSQQLFDWVRPFAFARHARPLSRLRQQHGLPSFQGGLQAAYTDSDLTLYADIPGLVSLKNPPAHHQVLGPILWSPAVALPLWWHELPEERPCIYVTLGSSGDPSILPKLLQVLGEYPYNVMLATAGKLLDISLPANVWQAAFLPGLAACERASLVICNGGSPTTQQALAAARPVLGICSNLDQLLNMEGVTGAGAGLSLRSRFATPARLRAAITRIIDDPRYTQSAARLAAVCASLDVAGDFSQHVRRLAARGC